MRLPFRHRAASAPPDAVWTPAQLWVVGAGGVGGTKAVVCLNHDDAAPDLALPSGVWTASECAAAASGGLVVTEVDDNLIARLPDGSTKSLYRPKPRMRWIAEERYAAVTSPGSAGSGPAPGQ